MSESQRRDLLAVAGPQLKGAGILDYVAGWYLKGAQLIAQYLEIRVAFVSTNSITQGEQVGLLWGEILQKYHCHIQFAHRTFRWSNEARGNAAVYCVIIGYGAEKLPSPRLFDYPTPRSAPHEIPAKGINPYLVDGPEVVVVKRSNPLSAGIPSINFGNMPLEGGHLLLSDEEKEALVAAEPNAAPFLKRFTGAQEFLHNIPRWCLWLEGITPSALKGLPLVLERVQQVKAFREASVAPSTQKFAATPTLFRDRALSAHYLLIPRHSSENRKYIPLGFLTNDNIPGDSCMVVHHATHYLFGVLTSEMHMVWVRQICGRLKSDFRYSKDIVYNNFPFPLAPTEAQKQAIAAAAEGVLAARAQFPGESLAALYDPATMPPALARAHQALDRAVDRCPSSPSWPGSSFCLASTSSSAPRCWGRPPRKAAASRPRGALALKSPSCRAQRSISLAAVIPTISRRQHARCFAALCMTLFFNFLSPATRAVSPPPQVGGRICAIR